MHCVKSVCIRSYSGPYFPALGLNTEKYSVRVRENTDQNNSKYWHFLRSDGLWLEAIAVPLFSYDLIMLLYYKTIPVALCYRTLVIALVLTMVFMSFKELVLFFQANKEIVLMRLQSSTWESNYFRALKLTWPLFTCSKWTMVAIVVNDVVLLSLLLTSNIFCTFFQRFYC